MSTRATMATLIGRTRDRIRDTSGSPHFTDQEIQDVLDGTRQRATMLWLSPQPQWGTGGTSWLVYLAPLDDWETDQVVQASDFSTLAVPGDYAFDDLTGTVTLVTTRVPPLYLTGKTYDLALGAALLLERWAGDLDAQFDFSADNARFTRSQQAAGKRAQAVQERMRARPVKEPMLGPAQRVGIGPAYLLRRGIR